MIIIIIIIMIIMIIIDQNLGRATMGKKKMAD
jgi:hypothetical protein